MTPIASRSLGLFRRLVLGGNLKHTLVRAALWGVAAILIVRYVAQPVRIHGVSMEPTYRDGSFHLVNRLRFRVGHPRRGDVVAIQMVGSRTYYLKRVLAVPGDAVIFSNGVLIVNGSPIAEPYVRAPCHWSMPAMSLGPDEYFVAGDNRNGPIETHVMGIVRRDRIVGGLWL